MLFKMCSFKWLFVCVSVSLRLQCWCLSPGQQWITLPRTPSHAFGLTGAFFFIFTLVRILAQINHCYDFSVSGKTARTQLWVMAAGEAFYVSQLSSLWKSTCFYKPFPLRNTCTEQQTHCFSLSYVVKVERAARQRQAGLLNHSSFLAPLGWLNSSCQKHSIMTDVGLEIL